MTIPICSSTAVHAHLHPYLHTLPLYLLHRLHPNLTSPSARFAALHAAELERTNQRRAVWRRESDALANQRAAMEETIALLEREVKLASNQLAGAAPAEVTDVELLLGQLEDKLLRTQHELEELRRASYFPALDGYQLRFSFAENYIGFKELLLETLRGTLRLRVTPGISKEGHAQLPTARFTFERSGEGMGKEPGALLRAFLAKASQPYSPCVRCSRLGDLRLRRKRKAATF